MGSSSPERQQDATTQDSPAGTTPATLRSELRKAIVLVQHQLNNPLAALLAEAQLLGMEPTLAAEHRAAAARITELTRRVIALVRELDAVAGDPGRQPADEPTPRS
jgi:signal transduction histidine kinase